MWVDGVGPSTVLAWLSLFASEEMTTPVVSHDFVSECRIRIDVPVRIGRRGRVCASEQCLAALLYPRREIMRARRFFELSGMKFD